MLLPILACFLLLDAGAARAGFAQKPVPQTQTISIKAMSFHLSTITVNVGDTIVWKNDDILPHDIRTKNGILSSPDLDPGESWHSVAKKRGTLHYYCALHPNMHGTLIIR